MNKSFLLALVFVLALTSVNALNITSFYNTTLNSTNNNVRIYFDIPVNVTDYIIGNDYVYLANSTYNDVSSGIECVHPIINRSSVGQFNATKFKTTYNYSCVKNNSNIGIYTLDTVKSGTSLHISRQLHVGIVNMTQNQIYIENATWTSSQGTFCNFSNMTHNTSSLFVSFDNIESYLSVLNVVGYVCPTVAAGGGGGGGTTQTQQQQQTNQQQTLVVTGGGGSSSEPIIIIINGREIKYSIDPRNTHVRGVAGGTIIDEFKITNEGKDPIFVDIYVDKNATNSTARDWLRFDEFDRVENLTINTQQSFESNAKYITYRIDVNPSTPLGSYPVIVAIESEGVRVNNTIIVDVVQSKWVELRLFMDEDLIDFKSFLCGLKENGCEIGQTPLALKVKHIVYMILSIMVVLSLLVVRNLTGRGDAHGSRS